MDQIQLYAAQAKARREQRAIDQAANVRLLNRLTTPDWAVVATAIPRPARDACDNDWEHGAGVVHIPGPPGTRTSATLCMLCATALLGLELVAGAVIDVDVLQ